MERIFTKHDAKTQCRVFIYDRGFAHPRGRFIITKWYPHPKNGELQTAQCYRQLKQAAIDHAERWLTDRAVKAATKARATATGSAQAKMVMATA